MNEELKDLLKSDLDAETKRILVENYSQERRSVADRELRDIDAINELDRIVKQKELDDRSVKKNFWVSSGFVGVISAVLTLGIGEYFGLLSIREKTNQQTAATLANTDSELEIASRQFERDMISQALNESDSDARIDALRLLVLADVIAGLTEEELIKYSNSLEGRSVPSIAPVAEFLPEANYVISGEDIELTKMIGNPGYGSQTPPLIKVPMPFDLKVAWNTSQRRRFIIFHKYGACALKRSFEKIYSHYGDRVHELGIDLHSGDYNPRKRRGTNIPSRHAWGIAFDLDVARNQLKWGRNRANFAHPDFDKMHEIFENEGIENMGRKKNFDWNHFEVTLEKLAEEEEPSECGLES